jgi:iron(III) transport system substrate-binding protein
MRKSTVFGNTQNLDRVIKKNPVKNLGIAIGLVVGFATMTAQPVTASEQVNIYTSRHYKADQDLFKAFEKETGIKVNTVQGKDNALFQRLKREGRNSPADLLVTVDAGNLGRAQKANLFQPIRSEKIYKAVPKRLRDPKGHWVGLTIRARVIMYHLDRVKPSALSTYEALKDKKWKGRILIRSSNNIYNQSLVASLIATMGKEKTLAWAKGFTANFARKPKGGDRDQIRGVGAGVADIAISNTYYLGRLTASKKAKDKALVAKIGVFFPNQGAGRGAHINISGVGITRHAKNVKNATRLIEFLLRKKSQKKYANANYEYPVRADIPLSGIVKAWGAFKADHINVVNFARFNADAVRIMDKAGWR